MARVSSQVPPFRSRHKEEGGGGRESNTSIQHWAKPTQVQFSGGMFASPGTETIWEMNLSLKIYLYIFDKRIKMGQNIK